MELVSAQVNEVSHCFLFETDTKKIELNFSWNDEYERVLIIPVILQQTAEHSVRSNVGQYGFYSDDFTRIRVFKKVFDFMVNRYRYPLAITSLNLPNRELIIISWAHSFSEQQAILLVTTIMLAEVVAEEKVAAEVTNEEEVLESDEIIIQDESIEEIIENDDDDDREKNFEKISIKTEEME